MEVQAEKFLSGKESELAALQAQINPHFLYNTLDSLYWQAMNADNEEIAESILALSQLFRLVLSQGKREVTVGQETELVSRYFQIQKMRFSKRLEYKINVEDSVKKAKIPKLILQPFVENAIVHGFENVSTPCELTVSGVRDGTRRKDRDSGRAGKSFCQRGTGIYRRTLCRRYFTVRSCGEDRHFRRLSVNSVFSESEL